MMNRIMLYAGISLGLYSVRETQCNSLHSSATITLMDERIQDINQRFTFTVGDNSKFSLCYNDREDQNGFINLTILTDIERRYRMERTIQGVESIATWKDNNISFSFHECGVNRVLCIQSVDSVIKRIAVTSITKIGNKSYNVDTVALTIDNNKTDINKLSNTKKIITILSTYLSTVGNIDVHRAITCNNVLHLSDHYRDLILFEVYGSLFVSIVHATTDGYYEIICNSDCLQHKKLFRISMPVESDGVRFDVEDNTQPQNHKKLSFDIPLHRIYFEEKYRNYEIDDNNIIFC